MRINWAKIVQMVLWWAELLDFNSYSNLHHKFLIAHKKDPQNFTIFKTEITFVFESYSARQFLPPWLKAVSSSSTAKSVALLFPMKWRSLVCRAMLPINHVASQSENNSMWMMNSKFPACFLTGNIAACVFLILNEGTCELNVKAYWELFAVLKFPSHFWYASSVAL